VLAARLEGPSGAFTLAEIGAGRRLNELEFTFPVLPGRAERLSASMLERALRMRIKAPWPADYPARVGRLGFRPLRGFLHGFIDLVFEHGGRFYLLDYKSNHLGDAPDDYVSERLSAAMAEHHYFLQYHLYAVALHRFLQTRKADYEFERHFGGVFYLFLRGMERETGAGVFFDQPPRASILELSRAFAGVAATAPSTVEGAVPHVD
jgi:exodeoxyribonuclease V beta subunit